MEELTLDERLALAKKRAREAGVLLSGLDEHDENSLSN
jgi:hypothetical protein